MRNLCAALEKWKEALGESYVVTSPQALAQAQTATFATTQRILAILRPVTREEVQVCVRIANIYEIPLYPISGGKNWGYGSQVPVQDGCVLLHLGRMQRILDFDEKLAYMTVEPGVTMRQAVQFLHERAAALFPSLPGGTWDGSLIGNAVERGLGSGRYADRFGSVCNFEVILPTGECIHTGFDRFSNAQASAIARWSVGPYLDGIFTQSSFGIVTRMTIWLLPTPRSSGICLFTLKEDAQLGKVIEALHTIKFEGAYDAPIHLFNDYKLLSMATQFTEDTPFIPPETMQGIRNALKLGAWNGLLILRYASRILYDAMRTYVCEVLTDVVDSLLFLDDDQSSSACLEHETPYTLDLLSVSSILGDIEKNSSIKTTYWRKNMIPPEHMDPDRDSCGVIWCAPLVPFTDQHVRKATEIIKSTCFSYQMEPHITLTCLTERSIVITVVLLYDRDVPVAEGKAAKCHDTLLHALTDAGYIPYRLGIQSMNVMSLPNDDTNLLLTRLKEELDPQHILAPGRYEPQQATR